jgi:hypothetical protein
MDIRGQSERHLALSLYQCGSSWNLKKWAPESNISKVNGLGTLRMVSWGGLYSALHGVSIMIIVAEALASLAHCGGGWNHDGLSGE